MLKSLEYVVQPAILVVFVQFVQSIGRAIHGQIILAELQKIEQILLDLLLIHGTSESRLDGLKIALLYLDVGWQKRINRG